LRPLGRGLFSRGLDANTMKTECVSNMVNNANAGRCSDMSGSPHDDTMEHTR